ncbi:8566_t:CDS:2, partial [Ambispora leptoticha]
RLSGRGAINIYELWQGHLELNCTAVSRTPYNNSGPTSQVNRCHYWPKPWLIRPCHSQKVKYSFSNK